MPGGKITKNIAECVYHLGILEVDGVKHEEMKGQIKKEYIRRVWKILKPKNSQFKSSFHCKIWGRNNTLDKDGTWRAWLGNKKADDNVWDTPS